MNVVGQHLLATSALKGRCCLRKKGCPGHLLSTDTERVREREGGREEGRERERNEKEIEEERQLDKDKRKQATPNKSEGVRLSI